MTPDRPSVSPERERLRSLVEKWRAQSKRTADSRVANMLNQHADDIEALLRAEAVRAQPATCPECEAAWKMIDQCYTLEPRALIESEAKTNGFVFGLVQAVFSLWKREPKVADLQAQLAAAQRALSGVALAAQREKDFMAGANATWTGSKWEFFHQCSWLDRCNCQESNEEAFAAYLAEPPSSTEGPR